MIETRIAPISDHSGGPCPPVGYELGNPTDIALFKSFPDTFAEVGTQLEQSHAYRLEDLETGEAARKATVALGCGTCLIKEACVVNTVLEDRIEAGAENEALTSKLDMIKNAPRWLNAGRLSLTNTDEKRLFWQLESDEATGDALKSGELDIDELLGGVENQPKTPVYRDQIPELRSFSAIDPGASLDVHRITTAAGKQFDVIDASTAVGFKGDDPELADFKILCGKFLARMTESSATGIPHILMPDQTMQKTIRRLGDTTVDEFRMNGKNRMYAIVNANAEDPELTARLIILGAHGGDAATQVRFINNVIPEK